MNPNKRASAKKKAEKQSMNGSIHSIHSSIESQHEFEQIYDSNYGFDSTYNQPDEHQIGFTNLTNKSFAPKSLNVKLKHQIQFHAKQN